MVRQFFQDDVDPIEIVEQQLGEASYTFKDVKPGIHKLTVQLVGNNHEPISQKIVYFKTGA